MNRLRVALVGLFALFGFATGAQTSRPIGGDMDFLDYLIGNNFTTDALSWLDSQPYAPSDTLDFLRGKSLYTAGRLDLASAEFSKVGAESAWYDGSVFFGVVSDVYLGRYDSGVQRLDGYRGEYPELRSYALAALSLLRDDRQGYKAASGAFTFSDYRLAEGERLFENIYTERYLKKHKSPALAAGLSALVPGLGKVYAGRYDEAIASFLTVGVLAGFTAESWVKKGPQDWRTVLFGTLGSLFYIGNIYGSYMSVGIYRDMLRDAQNSTVVFNLHLPVRNIFN